MEKRDFEETYLYHSGLFCNKCDEEIIRCNNCLHKFVSSDLVYCKELSPVEHTHLCEKCFGELE